jgi:hypothetical protein
MGPPGPISSQYGSQYSMSRTCGPRDIISLVIPRLGDNRSNINNPKSVNGMPPRFARQGEMLHYRGHPRLLRIDLRIP